MAKNKVVYECSACGEKHPKWQGKCSSCDAWNCLVETIAESSNSQNHRFNPLTQSSTVVSLTHVEAQDISRKQTGISELDRVLGGGIAIGSVILIGGDPGIGKSTLLLQTLDQLSKTNKVLYITGEESIQQVALRANRLGIFGDENLRLMAEIGLNQIISAIDKESPQVVVIDSIQTMYTELLQSAPGSVAQVRECASILTRLAKQKHITIIMVGHVTKDGSIAGPRVLEHIVDAVLYFEGEQHSNFRMLRGVKNRFGAVNELGVFAMTDKGLKEVNNPSALFLSSHRTKVPGSCILITQEGTRPLLVEVQALVDQSHIMPPKRLAVGMDNYRLSMLIAIMQRHLELRLFDQDIFLNVVGGVKVSEPAIDLAVTLAIISSYKNKYLPEKLAVCGEIGLSGEIRTIQKGQDRIKEAAKLGFERIIVPHANLPKEKIPNVEIIPVQNLRDVINYCF
ncbi:MAG: DNA repair protein RadA [Proteobacteria bacterium]|jgi:DNA repair protein RadA/Sms|nr:DNA repair protein RadA [Pseudomonadota bacterium]